MPVGTIAERHPLPASAVATWRTVPSPPTRDDQVGAGLDAPGGLPAHLALSPDDLGLDVEALGFEQAPTSWTDSAIGWPRRTRPMTKARDGRAVSRRSASFEPIKRGPYRCGCRGAGPR